MTYLLALLATLLAFAPRTVQALSDLPSMEAHEVGPLFRGADSRILGFDGAYSVSLGHERSLWMFGDTLLGSWLPDGHRLVTGFPTNTAALVRDGEWPVGFANARFFGAMAPGPVLLPAAKGNRTWPLDLVRVGSAISAYFVDIEPVSRSPLGFKVLGTGLAEAPMTHLGGFRRKAMLWPSQAPSFGGSVLARAGYLYLYSGGDPTYLARVPIHRMSQPSSYSYWAGSGRWDSDWKRGAPLPGSGPELSVRYNAYLKRFVMVFLPPFGRVIQARFARQPWGPWSAAVSVIACQPTGDPEAMFYGAKQHAELSSDDDRQIVLSYNTNTSEAALAARLDLYWPRLVVVTFHRADAR